MPCRADAAWRESLRKAGLVETAEFDCKWGVTKETAAAIQAEAVAKLPGYDPEAAAKIDAQKKQRDEQGRAAWGWLHENASTDSLTTERLAGEFVPMIPRYGCSCINEWQAILAKNPLPTKGQFVWSWTVHQAVNQKINKPGISLEEAMVFWSSLQVDKSETFR